MSRLIEPRAPAGKPAPARRAGGPASRSLLALVLVLLTGWGCALFVKRPSVSIASVTVGSVGLSGATAQVAVQIVNPNRFDLTAQEVRYRLSFADEEAEGGWRTLAEGDSDERMRISGRDTTQVRLSVPFSYADLGRALGSLLSIGELRYRLEGDVKFDAPVKDVRVPFDRRGTLSP